MTAKKTPPETEPDLARQAQKRRNLWLALALVAFVVIVGVTTAVRIQETDFSGSDRLYFSGYLDEAAKETSAREAQTTDTPELVSVPIETEADDND